MLHENLGERKRFLLRAIVHDYIDTAEPVASQVIVKRYPLRVKSATVRNEMAELSEMGLLRQPHTSSGRIPSDLGYRFYVDRLMPVVTPSPEAEREAQNIRQAIYDEIDEVLKQTCRLLTSLTHYTAVAAPPEAQGLSLREIHLSPMGGGRCLLVVAPYGSDARHRLIELPEPVAAAELTRLSRRLTDELQGTTFEAISGLLSETGEDRPEGVFRMLLEAISEMLQTPSSSDSLVVRGTRQMLQQPEFRDVSRLESLMEALEERRSVLELLREAVSAAQVQVIIGEENPEEGLRNCSLVAARYTAGPGSYGAIGIIGPTRMTYSVTLPTVQLVAEYLSDFFQRWNA